MKSNNSKRQRRKCVPLCFQKKSLSKSNSSLSQLLKLGSYKKRINDLVRNNRSLAVALQTARCETAYQTNILKDYARDCNQIRFARLKLQGMAKTITKLVTDLHEVMDCLDVDMASNNHNFHQKYGPHEKMKIKAPAVDYIEEVSVLSSENGGCAESSVSEPSAMSNEAASQSDETNEIQLSPSKRIANLADDLDSLPVLFVDDPEDNYIERNSRRNKSSRKSVLIDQTSLTPELDIDFPHVMRKSSSRRQTQFIPSARSSSRSSRKSNCNQSLSAENATPKRSILPSGSIPNRKLSSTMMDCQQLSEENKNPENASVNLKKSISKKLSSSPPELDCEQYSEKNKIAPYAFVNMKERGSKDANSPPPNLQCTSKEITSHDNLNMPSNIPQKVIAANENTESNHTILFCDDMELTEVIRPAQQIFSNSPTAVGFPPGPTDVHPSIPEENELNTSVEKMLCNDQLFKLMENSETVAVFSKDKHLNETHFNEKCSVSPPKRSSRNRKNVVYKVFLSSDESDRDSTPIKSEVKHKSHKIQRDTVNFKPKSCSRAFYTKDNSESDEKCHLKEMHASKKSQDLFSVYDLDVSNSKKPAKKKKQKSKTKISSHNEEISKPLLQNWNVKKLQGIDYKFTKNKNSLPKVKENQLLQNCNSSLEVNPTASTDETVKRNQSNLVEGPDARIENRQSINSGNRISVARLNDFQHQEIIRTPKSEVRRVSFASTDLVCNFTKSSVSKTIAGNKKVHRASKSVFEPEEVSNQESSGDKDLQFETNKPFGDVVEASHNSEDLFNFREATELYTFTLPTDSLLNTMKADEHTSSKTFSTVTIPSKLYDDQNSKQGKLAVEQKCGKLSLRGNKKSQKNVQLHTPDKIDKDITKPLHSHSPVVQPKCKSSHEEFSLNDLKENMSLNPQTLNISQANVQIKSATSKSLVAPVKDSLPVPVDDLIKRPTKSSCKKKPVSEKQDLLQITPDKTSKKSSNRRKLLGSSPVLKDVVNVEEGNRESVKRRSKFVSYKEPSLNKKMRRE